MELGILRVALLLLGTGTVLAGPTSLQEMKPEAVIALDGDMRHVQGLLVSAERIYVTAVDRTAHKAFLFEHDRKTGRRLRAVEIQRGARYHPGGFDEDEGSLWIPVAEYRPGSSTVVQRRSRKTLELLSSFEFSDHIGAIAVGPDRLYAANWDARVITEISPEGRVLRARKNPTPLALQDWKYRYGMLVASAVAPSGPQGTSVVWMDPQTLELLKTVPAGLTERGPTNV